MEKSLRADAVGTRGPFMRFASHTLDHSDRIALAQDQLAVAARRPGNRRKKHALHGTYAALNETKDILAQAALSIQRSVGAIADGEAAAAHANDAARKVA